MTDLVLKPRYGRGRYFAQRRRVSADAKAKELALRWPSHRAFLGIDLELQAHENDAERAARARLAILEAVTKLAHGLKIERHL